MDEERRAVLDQLVVIASRYSGRAAQPNSRIYGDLDINGGDFIQFVEEVERRYDVDLSWVSPPRGSGASAEDATVEAIASNIIQQRQ